MGITTLFFFNSVHSHSRFSKLLCKSDLMLSVLAKKIKNQAETGEITQFKIAFLFKVKIH